MNEVEEISKAIQNSAKLGEKGLEIANKAGSFFAKVFKEPIDEISGIITDKLRFIRWKRLIEISDEVNTILEKRRITNTKAVPPKIAIPLIEHATLEEDNELKKLWVNLLSNAMDPDFNSEIRYGFIEMINGITGVEARILSIFYNSLKENNQLDPLENISQYQVKKENLISSLGISVSVYLISANNLMRMQLISPAILKASAKVGSESITIYKGTDAITLTPLGIKFIEACLK